AASPPSPAGAAALDERAASPLSPAGVAAAGKPEGSLPEAAGAKAGWTAAAAATGRSDRPSAAFFPPPDGHQAWLNTPALCAAFSAMTAAGPTMTPHTPTVTSPAHRAK